MVISLGVVQRAAFLEQRSQLRQQLIHEEDERQRLRAIVAHCQLLRIYLILDNVQLAHKSLCESFSFCRSTVEHSELLNYCHAILKDFSVNVILIVEHLLSDTI